MKKIFLLMSVLLCPSLLFSQKITPVSFEKVSINDAFWSPIIKKTATVAIPACIEQLKKDGHVMNFENAGQGIMKHRGANAFDSDLFKVLEGMAYAIKQSPENKNLEVIADQWIDKIAAAQQPDGYLDTYYILKIGLDNKWTNMQDHEDYCAGHMFEAAVAYYNATGKRKFLDVAIKLADHMDRTFRLADNHWVTGHEEVKIGLVKLYKATHNENYLKLAKWFIEQRGHGYWRGKAWGDVKYYQDDVPVKDARKIVGHAVRAMYLYSGVCDIASYLNDHTYDQTLFSVWDNMIGKNMYVTGGIGTTSKRNEGFSEDYDLSNDFAYCETCASVAMVFLGQRMHSMTGESKYYDVLERALYNAALDGMSYKGDRFFYPNKLKSTGSQRSTWFNPACCPSNLCRMFTSIGNYIYSESDHATYVNLFVSSKTENDKVNIAMEGNCAADGKMAINVSGKTKDNYSVKVRIPDWAVSKEIALGAYYFEDNDYQSPITFTINGKKADYKMDKGYAVFNRVWGDNDVIRFQLPVVPRRLLSTPKITTNAGLVAIQRGPLVYCFEHCDNEGDVFVDELPSDAKLKSKFEKDLFDGTTVVKAGNMTAIPYYLWANREKGKMAVWVNEEKK